jgi:hypothetical protein
MDHCSILKQLLDLDREVYDPQPPLSVGDMDIAKLCPLILHVRKYESQPPKVQKMEISTLCLLLLQVLRDIVIVIR